MSIDKRVSIVLESLVGCFDSVEKLGLYQIGSSVNAEGRLPVEVDLLFVDLLSEENPYGLHLHGLAEAINGGRPHMGAFGSTDIRTRLLVEKALVRAQENLEPTRGRAEFSFGPLREEPQANELVLHVCGPLTLRDLASLSQCLQFHALGFLTKHRVLLGPPLESILPKPCVSHEDLRRWDAAMLLILQGQSSPEYRVKTIRKIILCNLLYRGDIGSYEGVDRILGELGFSSNLSALELFDLAQRVIEAMESGVS